MGTLIQRFARIEMSSNLADCILANSIRPKELFKIHRVHSYLTHPSTRLGESLIKSYPKL